VSEWTLDDISEKLRDIDFAMLLTHTESGEIVGRPMSNNRDVEYDGDSYFFTSEQTRTVADLKRDRKVALAYRGDEGLLGKPPVFITVQGQAELIRDKDEFKAHWTEDLERWFEDGVETAGLVATSLVFCSTADPLSLRKLLSDRYGNDGKCLRRRIGFRSDRSQAY
jgi:general stress protein 26